MMTCNQCGSSVPAGLVMCPKCGIHLVEVGNVTKSVTSDQHVLPAWLESLRNGEEAVVPDDQRESFSVADLVDKDTLPSWMRGRNVEDESAKDSSSTQQIALRRASTTAPTTEDGFPSTQDMDIHSLIDEQSLPAWMREKQPIQEHISPANLLESESLPTWMKTMPPQAPSTMTPQPVQQFEQTTPPAPTAFSAPPSGLSAQDLIDPQSLPQWMSENQNTPLGNENNQRSQSAASLLDMDALPSWLREQSMHTSESPQSEDVPHMKTNLTAASLIDMNALPAWLQNTAEEQQGRAGSIVRGTLGPASHVENVRVPSRPRGEVESHEDSEVAASVFSSMLGVASASPAFSTTKADRSSILSQPATENTLLANQSISSGLQPARNYALEHAQSGGTQYPPDNNTNIAAADQLKAQARSTRRSFLETIRDWFSFSR